MNIQMVLDLPLSKNDAGADTVRDYLKALVRAVWKEGEDFSGKRPFGNGAWKHDIYRALIRAGFVNGRMDSDGCIDRMDSSAADKLVLLAIQALR